MPTVLLGLGSNQGDRHATLALALDHITRLAPISVRAVSGFREYPAAGGDTAQIPYLNAAALLHTQLTPIEVLRTLQETEERLGRKRSERWGARTLDLDILLFDDLVCVTSELAIPHPRLAGRIFALEPAVEIAADRVHPTCGMTLAAMLAHLVESPPWIALAPAGFWEGSAAPSGPENHAVPGDSAEGFLRACEQATARVAADCVALLRARAREKSISSGLPALFDFRFPDENAGIVPTIRERRRNKGLTPESASRLHDASICESLPVPITAFWKPLESALARETAESLLPADQWLPRVVIHGPTALQCLPRMSPAWQRTRESQESSDFGTCHSPPKGAIGSERFFACLRREIESCRGKVPMVFVESQTRPSIIAEVAGIVEGVLQSATS